MMMDWNNWDWRYHLKNNYKTIESILEGFSLILSISSLFRCSKLSDRGIERLCQGFDELNQLTNLSLNFSWTDNISNVSLEYLRKSLEKQINLKSLSFDFHSLSLSSSNSSGVSDVGVGFLSKALAKLTNLTFLSFNMEK